jgi:hypothetical protein
VSSINPNTVSAWAGLVAQLVSMGIVAEQQIVAAIKANRGLTDTDTLAEDDVMLVKVRTQLAAIKARAQAEANRTE